MSIITDAKQANLINAESLNKWKVKVFGIGSIGSNLIKQLALVGFKDITAYDYDTVDEDNIGSQEFDARHIGMKKTEAIQSLMKQGYGFDVAVSDGKITKDTQILPDENTVYFCSFDSLEARQMLWDKLKGFPVFWGESRIGLTSQRFYFVDLKNGDDEWVKKYEATLDPNGPRTELKCGEKGCYPSNVELVGKIVRQIVNIAEGKDLATMFVGDWGMPSAIFIMPEQEVPKEIIYD